MAAGVAASNMERSGTSTPSARRTRAITCVAWREWPPSSKNPSSTPTSARPSTSRKMPATASSTGPRAAVAATGRPAGRGWAAHARSTLPFGGERERVERDDLVGHERRGQAPREEGAQRGGRDGSMIERHHVGVEPRLRLDVARHHDGLAHRGVLAQGGLDLAGLHADAADLDLVVQPAEDLQRAVGPVAAAIAGAVEAIAVVVAERIAGEAGLVLGRRAEVPQAAERRPQGDLARLADAAEPPVRGEHQRLRLGQGPAHRLHARGWARRAPRGSTWPAWSRWARRG